MIQLDKIRHIFFDLDRTLWDFDTNSEEALRELYQKLGPKPFNSADCDNFVKIYQEVNEQHWEKYRHGQIGKDYLRRNRFVETFAQLEITNIPENTWELYLDICPRKSRLINGAHELLKFLSQHFKLHIITNGFYETQQLKLKHSGIRDYFQHVFASDVIGHQKPHKEIFSYALQNSGATPEDSLYIGDDYKVDVLGAIDAGIYPIHFTHSENTLAVEGSFLSYGKHAQLLDWFKNQMG